MEENKEVQENQEEEYTLEVEDSLNVNITLDEVQELNEEDIEILAQKVEYNIDRYEDMLVKAENEYLSEEELLKLGYDDEEYHRLKELDKALYKHKRELKKMNHEKGFFAYLPVWCAIIGILVFVFNVYPVNPLLIETYLVEISEKILENNTYDHKFILYFLYFVYIGIFYVTEILSLLALLIVAKIKKDKNLMKSFYSYLVITVIDVIALLPGLISFLNTMANL